MNIGAIIGGVVGGFFVILLLIIALIYYKKKQRKSPEPSQEVPLQNISVEKPPTDSKMTVIKDIQVKHRLGGGNFSDVYLGDWQV
jgi:flagellar biogenesis protein FliO